MQRSTERPVVLVVDDDPEVRRIVARTLAADGISVATADGAEAAFSFLEHSVPDLVLLDLVLPGQSGLELCARIRNAIGFAHVPLVALSALADRKNRLAAITAGVDDFVGKPFDLLDLVATVRMHLRRSTREQQLNPLTRLPGNPAIEETIRRRLAAGEEFALCLLDLDHFKAYNDRYGFLAGDEVIRLLADILVGTCRELLGHHGFAGHVGGDDFVAIMQLEQVDAFCRRVIARFDAEVPGRYAPEDRARGYIEVLDRRGQAQRFPLLSLSIAVVVQRNNLLRHPAEIAERAAEIKRYLKTLPGSNYLVDRRIGAAERVGQRPGEGR